jgi:uncharacterized RDD family membrane protein YckC
MRDLDGTHVPLRASRCEFAENVLDRRLALVRFTLLTGPVILHWSAALRSGQSGVRSAYHRPRKTDISMADALQFETPENVHVAYTPAGPGTRFIAWFVDQFFVFLFVLLVAIVLAVAGVSFAGAQEWMDEHSDDPESVGMVMIGILFLVGGLGSFGYFTFTELLLRGQTIGKKMIGIRVVKADGFALDPASVLIRNVFRVVDNLPLSWIVPVMSKRSQRLGDMVGGTIVVNDEQPEMTSVREQLSDRTAVEAEFRFEARALDRLKESDFETIEQLLERWPGIPEAQQQLLLGRILPPVVAKLKVEGPPDDRRVRFLEDLLAAELRRQGRALGG